jgi:CubicO group peptidase (beta-lactamase class C family)
MTDLQARMRTHVERNEMPGLVALADRAGDVEVVVLGHAATGGAPMQRDTLFRIASMTKPVTATAAMILVDEGKLRLDEPVDRFLPELANRRVLKRLDGPLDAPLENTVAATRAITLRDLLTFRQGFGIVFGPGEPPPIVRAANELKLGAFGPPVPLDPPAPDEWIRRFATLPLMHQPGERWMYNTGAEILGVLVARAARVPFDAFLRDRIFGPLGMHDTFFSVPEAKIDRLATAYWAHDPFHPDAAGYDLRDSARGGQWSRPPAFPSGGGGLVSTADDYLAFARMLLARGTRGRTRILSEASVTAMTTDQLTREEKARSQFMPPNYWDENGWGFGMSVTTAPDALTGAVGRYGWDGGLGTSWANDPAKGLVGILLTQRAAFPIMAGVYRDFWSALYGRPCPPSPI